MVRLTRITVDSEVMGGKPCIRGLRVTVGTSVGLVAAGRSIPEIVAAYPYLEEQDIREALSYAAWRVKETDPMALKADTRDSGAGVRGAKGAARSARSPGRGPACVALPALWAGSH